MTPELIHSLEVTLWLSIFVAPLGCFLVFRRLSFLGDALSHATLAGVAVSAILFGLNFIALSLGAIASAFTATFLLQFFERRWKIPADIALTVSYSGLFALGLLLLSQQKMELDHFLVGDIRAVNEEALWFLRAWALIVLGSIALGWKGLWLGVVDPKLGRALGFSRVATEYWLLILLSVSAVGLMQTVGVVLVAAYLVVPTVTALPWARSLRALAAGSVISALISSGLGIALWTVNPANAFGPLLALSAFSLFVLSHALKWTLRGQSR